MGHLEGHLPSLVAVLEAAEAERGLREMRLASRVLSRKTFSHDACSDQEHFAVLLVGAWSEYQQVVVSRLEPHVRLLKLGQWVQQVRSFQARLG